MKNEIALNLGDASYKIRVGAGEIAHLKQFLQQKKYSKIFVVSDKIVANLHFAKLKEALTGFDPVLVRIESGEQSKSFTILEKTCEEILAQNLDRKSLLIALGGGVVGDLTGFMASILLRGVDFVQVPTTLLACVDSSVGGKTAINSKFGKNLIGSFYQPKLVICDLNFLATLPPRELRAGYAEVLKYGLIEDREFFDFLDENVEKIFAKNQEILHKIIAKSCEIKARIVSQDEKESGVRALLNFGHTFAHVFENELNYSNELLHGEAVGIGMLFAAQMSLNLEMIDAKEFEIIKNHITKSGLNINLKKIRQNWNIENLVKNLYKDKKTEAKNLTFILLEKIGKAAIKKSIDVAEFKKVILAYLG